ncbi:MAG: L,D-transpeptidase [Variibacter sp.]|nr:L,D-transpeptidase [Variibacter sp.]
MQRIRSLAVVPALLAASAALSLAAQASPLGFSADEPDGSAEILERPAPRSEPVRYAAARRGHMGGGLIEFLFGGSADEAPPARGPIYAPGYADPRAYPRYEVDPRAGRRYARGEPAWRTEADMPAIDPKYERQVVEYHGREKPGTIIIDTPNRFLYLVQEGGKALRYGIGVGRPGFTWSGVKTVTMKREWPDWRPPPEMLKRRPDLPRYMPGGPDNPLGARALYLGSSLYRIHGSNEPWTIGTAVSSGCIRMRNEDVIDLYNRVPVGTRVVVI